MADTQAATVQLSPDEWKALCVTNAAQLHAYLQSIPPVSNDGSSGITDQHIELIQGHVTRGAAFIAAWRRSRIAGTTAQPQPAASQAVANGAAPESKRRGGWPKGKSRKAVAENAPQ